MKIKSVGITSRRLPLKAPSMWSQGIEEAFVSDLIAMEAEDAVAQAADVFRKHDWA